MDAGCFSMSFEGDFASELMLRVRGCSLEWGRVMGGVLGEAIFRELTAKLKYVCTHSHYSCLKVHVEF